MLVNDLENVKNLGKMVGMLVKLRNAGNAENFGKCRECCKSSKVFENASRNHVKCRKVHRLLGKNDENVENLQKTVRMFENLKNAENVEKLQKSLRNAGNVKNSYNT